MVFDGKGRWRLLLGKKLVSVLVPAALAVCLILANGCGAYNPNGTGGGTGGTDTGQAQGFYILQLQSGPTLAALITPTDQFWGMLGTSSISSFSVTGLATGQGTSTTSGYSGTLTAFSSSGVSFTDTIAATDVANSSMSGTFTINGVQTGIGGVALPTATYSYGTAATVASITAVSSNWSGSLLDGTSLAISIAASGTISPAAATGCQVVASSSSITPDSSNKNFYDVQLTFGLSPCSLAGQTVKGIGLFYLLPDGVTHQLLLAGTAGTS